MGKHSIQTIINFLQNLSILDINYFDLIIAKKTPVLLCIGKEIKNCFYKPEILMNQLLLNLANPEKETNLNECLDILINIKNNSNSKKYFSFVFTDALFDNNNEKEEIITNKLSICNYYGIDIFGIGLGFCPLKLPLVFPRCFWVSDPKNLISIISVLFGNDIETEKKLEINYSNKSNKKEYKNDLNSLINTLKEEELFKNKELNNFLNERKDIEKEKIENPDITDNIDENPDDRDKTKTMCPENSFKGLKALICVFWDKSIAGQNENQSIQIETLLQSEKKKYSLFKRGI